MYIMNYEYIYIYNYIYNYIYIIIYIIIYIYIPEFGGFGGPCETFLILETGSPRYSEIHTG